MKVHRKNKMKHEGWNIIQEHMITWLDAFIATEQWTP